MDLSNNFSKRNSVVTCRDGAKHTSNRNGIAQNCQLSNALYDFILLSKQNYRKNRNFKTVCVGLLLSNDRPDSNVYVVVWLLIVETFFFERDEQIRFGENCTPSNYPRDTLDVRFEIRARHRGRLLVGVFNLFQVFRNTLFIVSGRRVNGKSVFINAFIN